MKKLISMIMIFVTCVISATVASASSACLSASPLSSKTVKSGGEVIFTLNYTNDINKITITNKDISLLGFEGNIKIYSHENFRTIIISDIKNSSTGLKKRIQIKNGTAYSSDGIGANSIMTKSFIIK